MKALIQRVSRASVEINGEVYSKVGKGILLFLGIEKTDTEENAVQMRDKILNLRIFEDENEKMNYSLKDIDGELLIVSQFTLAGSTKKGNRPSFDGAMKGEEAKLLYEKFVELCLEITDKVKTGCFGAMMDINLVNDGPVTFLVEK